MFSIYFDSETDFNSMLSHNVNAHCNLSLHNTACKICMEHRITEIDWYGFLLEPFTFSANCVYKILVPTIIMNLMWEEQKIQLTLVTGKSKLSCVWPSVFLVWHFIYFTQQKHRTISNWQTSRHNEWPNDNI